MVGRLEDLPVQQQRTYNETDKVINLRTGPSPVSISLSLRWIKYTPGQVAAGDGGCCEEQFVVTGLSWSGVNDDGREKIT